MRVYLTESSSNLDSGITVLSLFDGESRQLVLLDAEGGAGGFEAGGGGGEVKVGGVGIYLDEGDAMTAPGDFEVCKGP
jgi:hypothetical protein